MLPQTIHYWVSHFLNHSSWQVTALPQDCSPRCYYRITQASDTYILMVTNPHESSFAAFINIAKVWREHAIKVPDILAINAQNGWMLISDFGNILLSSQLNIHNVDNLYKKALEILPLIHSVNALYLPIYSEAQIEKELNLFPEWFLNKLLKIELTVSQQKFFETLHTKLIKVFTTQPQVNVHRDFHASNLMVLENQALGVIDFQDAMLGPITYDAVSLLKDSRMNWPMHKMNQWIDEFTHHLHLFNPDISVDNARFWCDWTALQLHLKILGIFSRQHVLHQRSHYLKYIPGLLKHILNMTQHYSELNELSALFNHQIIPAYQGFEQALLVNE